MRADAVIVGVAGVFFGLLVGWILGTQQGGTTAPVASPAVTAAAPPAGGTPSGTSAGASRAAPIDVAKVEALEARAAAAPDDAGVRAELGNLFFDADRFADAARWYEESLARAPANPDVSTDLAIAYYYLNQAERAIRQFEVSLTIDPTHTKSLLNLGIVRAFGTQDLRGAAEAWERVVALAPAESPEGRAARQALDGLRSAHPEVVTPTTATPQGS
jgi:Flp pilus assembly protein TadD